MCTLHTILIICIYSTIKVSPCPIRGGGGGGRPYRPTSETIPNHFLLFARLVQSWWGTPTPYSPHRRKIRFIEDNEKCRHLTKFTCTGTLRQVFICLMIGTPYRLPPPLTRITVYIILIHTGKGGGGGVAPESRGAGWQFTNLGRKYQHERLYSMYIHL